MDSYQFIKISLLSDTTFGTGNGTAGVVDVEIDHDELGLPVLRGKAIRGLLRDTWLSMRDKFPELHEAEERIFGPPRDLSESSILVIGDGVVDEETRQWIEAAENREHHPLSNLDVLEAVTDIRRQTSEERSTGAPADKSLRSTRVVIGGRRLKKSMNKDKDDEEIVEGLSLIAPLVWLEKPKEKDIQCLALALLGTRHAGLARNRGRGHISMAFNGDLDITRKAAKGEKI